MNQSIGLLGQEVAAHKWINKGIHLNAQIESPQRSSKNLLGHGAQQTQNIKLAKLFCYEI